MNHNRRISVFFPFWGCEKFKHLLLLGFLPIWSRVRAEQRAIKPSESSLQNWPPSSGPRYAVRSHCHTCMKKWYHLLSELSWPPAFPGYLGSLGLLLVRLWHVEQKVQRNWACFYLWSSRIERACVDWMRCITSYSILSCPKEGTPPLAISATGASVFPKFCFIAQGWHRLENSSLFHYLPVVLEPASPRHLLEVSLLRPHPRPTKSEVLGGEPSILCFNEPSRWSDAYKGLRTYDHNHRVSSKHLWVVTSFLC